MNRNTRIVLVTAALLAALLQGCTTTPKPPPTEPPAGEQPTEGRELSEVEQLLLQAESATPLARAEYTLQAAERLADQGERETSRRLLSEINPLLLSDAQLQRRWLLTAELDLADGQPEQARDDLARLPQPASLPTELAQRLAVVRLQIEQLLGDTQTALMALIDQSERQPADQQARFATRIWALIQQLGDAPLKQLAGATDNSYLQQGWLELGLLTRQPGQDILARDEALEDWLKLWNLHPAALALPEELERLRANHPRPAQHIGVLLPQSGPLAEPARAIIEGILAAHYQRQQQGRETPRLSLFDSAQIDDLEGFYLRAQHLGIDRLIGPLDKDRLSRLGQQPELGLPTLALNYAETGSSAVDLYQFGLRGEDEARQAAQRAWADGHRVAVSLTPDTAWGQRILAAFVEEWSRLGGVLAAQAAFTGEQDFSDKIRTLLAVDRSEARAKTLLGLVTEKFEFDARRRQDVDFLFLSALAKDARQIKPILAFHFAGSLPVYATSHIYSGTPTPLKDQDLNGIQFCDIPWVLDDANALQTQMQQHRKDTHTRFGKLYALGIDAYRLLPYLEQLQALPGSHLNGQTGRLEIDAQGRVMRRLDWAQIRDGLPRRLPAP